MIGGLLKDLVVAGATAAARELVKLIVGKPKEEPEPEPPHLTWKDVEHIRAQQRSATAHKVPPKPTITKR